MLQFAVKGTLGIFSFDEISFNREEQTCIFSDKKLHFSVKPIDIANVLLKTKADGKAIVINITNKDQKISKNFPDELSTEITCLEQEHTHHLYRCFLYFMQRKMGLLVPKNNDLHQSERRYSKVSQSNDLKVLSGNLLPTLSTFSEIPNINVNPFPNRPIISDFNEIENHLKANNQIEFIRLKEVKINKINSIFKNDFIEKLIPFLLEELQKPFSKCAVVRKNSNNKVLATTFNIEYDSRKIYSLENIIEKSQFLKNDSDNPKFDDFETTPTTTTSRPDLPNENDPNKTIDQHAELAVKNSESQFRENVNLIHSKISQKFTNIFAKSYSFSNVFLLFLKLKPLFGENQSIQLTPFHFIHDVAQMVNRLNFSTLTKKYKVIISVEIVFAFGSAVIWIKDFILDLIFKWKNKERVKLLKSVQNNDCWVLNQDQFFCFYSIVFSAEIELLQEAYDKIISGIIWKLRNSKNGEDCWTSFLKIVCTINHEMGLVFEKRNDVATSQFVQSFREIVFKDVNSIRDILVECLGHIKQRC